MERSASSAAAAFAARAASLGLKPPVRLYGVDARAWTILTSGGPSRSGDALLLDEFGDLWWGRLTGPATALVTRACWPEEAAFCASAIRAMMESMAGAPASPN